MLVEKYLIYRKEKRLMVLVIKIKIMDKKLMELVEI